MDKIKTVEKQDLMDMLGITARTLKGIENQNKLSERLEKIGYILHEKFKQGRKVYYNIEQTNSQKQTANQLMKHYYNTTSFEQFSNYFSMRTGCAKNNVCTTIYKLSNHLDTSAKTVNTWDLMLIDKSILAKDGYYYFSREIDQETGNYINRRISKEEYKSFWKNKGYSRAMKSLQKKYDEGIITFAELQLAIADASEILKVINNKYCFRIKKYLVNEDNPMYIDTLDLLKGAYLTNVHLDLQQLSIEENIE